MPDLEHSPEVAYRWNEVERLSRELMVLLGALDSPWKEDAVSLYIRCSVKAHLVENRDPDEIVNAVEQARRRHGV